MLALAEFINMPDNKGADDRDSVAGTNSDDAPKSIMPLTVVSTAVNTMAGTKASTNDVADANSDPGLAGGTFCPYHFLIKEMKAQLHPNSLPPHLQLTSNSPYLR